jgi:uncharacterized protein (TIGR02172 family)
MNYTEAIKPRLQKGRTPFKKINSSLDNEVLLGKGRTADVFAWGEGRILKLYQSWMPAPSVEREYLVTQAAQAAGLPVPAPFDLLEMGGRYGIVFEKIDGISMLSELQQKPWILFAIARQFAELHAQIHERQVPLEVPSQRQQIESGINATQKLTDAEKHVAQSCLLKLPGGDSLCHGDFHPDNILLSEKGPIIIDWFTGTRGNPLADVARTSLLFQTAGLPPSTPVLMRLLINLSRKVLLSIYINRYLQLCPAMRKQIDQWRLPLTVARLREVEGFPHEERLLLQWLKDKIKRSYQ